MSVQLAFSPRTMNAQTAMLGNMGSRLIYLADLTPAQAYKGDETWQ